MKWCQKFSCIIDVVHESLRRWYDWKVGTLHSERINVTFIVLIIILTTFLDKPKFRVVLTRREYLRVNIDCREAHLTVVFGKFSDGVFAGHWTSKKNKSTTTSTCWLSSCLFLPSCTHRNWLCVLRLFIRWLFVCHYVKPYDTFITQINN